MTGDSKCVGFARRRRTAAAWLLLCALAPQSVAGDMPTVVDAAERVVAASDADRIVSIGGAVTEILYALGRESSIVAVDTTSLYPPQALAQKPNVGYMRQLSAEGVLALRPSLILSVGGAGPKETIGILEQAGIPFVSVPERFTGGGVLDKIKLVAAVVGAERRGECVVSAVRSDLAALEQLKPQIARPVRVLFVLSMAGGRLMVAGRDTAADGIISLAGGTNAVTSYSGYKAVSDEAIVAARPDAVLVMQRSQQTLTAKEIFAHPAFATTPAASRKAFIAIEGLYLLGFGPRTAAAARDLLSSLYPDLKPEKLPSETREAPFGLCG